MENNKTMTERYIRRYLAGARSLSAEASILTGISNLFLKESSRYLELYSTIILAHLCVNEEDDKDAVIEDISPYLGNRTL